MANVLQQQVAVPFVLVRLELELELAFERADFEDHFLEFEESGLETFLRWDFLFGFVLLVGQLVQLVYFL
jgi:hypothetical protein